MTSGAGSCILSASARLAGALVLNQASLRHLSLTEVGHYLLSNPEVLWRRGKKPLPCQGEECTVIRRYPGAPLRDCVRNYKECPWRSGSEGKALCLLATPPGEYTYSELASALGTPFKKSSGTYTAEEVGDLFGVGKQRALAIEKGAILKLRRAVAERYKLPGSMRESAMWIYEALPDYIEEPDPDTMVE